MKVGVGVDLGVPVGFRLGVYEGTSVGSSSPSSQFSSSPPLLGDERAGDVTEGTGSAFIAEVNAGELGTH